ncbi:MAG: 6-phospho-beta-glucosidase [Chloroflexota bacterium]
MKITVIGGGSTYTPELVLGLLARADTLPLLELWLMDVDMERLAIVGGFAQRIAAANEASFKVILTDDRREAVRGASYVITQLRVGQMPARRADEYLGLRHGLIGQETTGVGGMAKALRTIPVALGIAADMRELAPGALLVNFTNPAGLVTEALTRHAPDVPAVGVCNIPITAKMMLIKLLQEVTGETIAPKRVELKTLGLNHLTWHYGLTLDGEDVWPRLLGTYIERLRANDKPEWNPDLIETLGMIPGYYLHYFYETQHMLSTQEAWPPSRAETVMEIEAGLLRQYAEPDRSVPPEGLMLRGGAYYSTMATQLLNAHYNNMGETHVVNIRHNGAVAGWPTDWVLEMPCRVDSSGIYPIPAQPLPDVCFGLLAHVKSYELLTVEAAVHGDRRAAYQALLAHPLGPSSGQVKTVLDDLLETNRAFLPQFFS